MRILIIDSEREGDRVEHILREALPDIEWVRARTHDQALMPLFGYHLHHDWVLINMSSSISRSSVDLSQGPTWFAKEIRGLLRIPVLGYSSFYSKEKLGFLGNMVGEWCTGIVDIAVIVAGVCQNIGRLVPPKYLPPFPESTFKEEPLLSFRAGLSPIAPETCQPLEHFRAQREARRVVR